MPHKTFIIFAIWKIQILPQIVFTNYLKWQKMTKTYRKSRAVGLIQENKKVTHCKIFWRHLKSALQTSSVLSERPDTVRALLSCQWTSPQLNFRGRSNLYYIWQQSRYKHTFHLVGTNITRWLALCTDFANTWFLCIQNILIKNTRGAPWTSPYTQVKQTSTTVCKSVYAH